MIANPIIPTMAAEMYVLNKSALLSKGGDVADGCPAPTADVGGSVLKSLESLLLMEAR